MARRKHSAALFEVISKDKLVTSQARPGLLTVIGSWFRAKPAVASEVAFERSPAPTPPPAPVSAKAPPMRSTGGSYAGRPVAFDSDRQEISFRLSYTSAAITLFALATAVGGAFVAGRKATLGPQAMTATNTVDTRLGPIQGNVTNLARTAVQMPNVAVQVEGPAGQTGSSAAPPARQTNVANSSVVQGRTRKPGLQYVVVQSYPSEEADMAKEAVKVLSANGIDCTIEKSVPGWNRYLVVMGTSGFERISNNAQHEAYVRKIKNISEKHYKRNSFKAFSPVVVRWDPNKKS